MSIGRPGQIAAAPPGYTDGSSRALRWLLAAVLLVALASSGCLSPAEALPREVLPGGRRCDYTEAELRLLVKAAILARLYETAVKPAELFAPLRHAPRGQIRWNLARTDLFQGGACCDFDTRRLCVTFDGRPYRETSDSWVLERVSPWAGAYEQPDGMGVRRLDAGALRPGASEKGATTLLYVEQWPPGSGIAAAAKTPAQVAALLVHEQFHVLHIRKHASMLDYELAVYFPPGSNWSVLYRAFEADPLSILPYMADDPYEPLVNQFGLEGDVAAWTARQLAAFRRIMSRPKELTYWAYRYLPTEIQAFNAGYRARVFFERPDVQARMKAMFKDYWEAVIEGR